MEKRDIKVNPYKIMIVDDDPLVIKTLERLLFRMNYLFFSVGSGEEALEMLQESEPDMILLDVFMKGITGFEVCEELNKRGITKKIPVIFLTSNDQATEVLKGFRAGAVDYIIKPFNTDELLARIETHLALKKAREEIKVMNITKTRFFSIMTHEIKDALTGVKGVAEFLNDELNLQTIDVDEIKKLSSLLLADSVDLFHFVTSLIKWEQIETDTHIPAILPINIEKIIEELTVKFQDGIKEKKLTISKILPEKHIMFSDQNAVKDIMHEILKNAIKYSYVDGQIKIKVEKEAGVNVIIIEDEGVGMDKDVAENVFRLDTPHPKTIGTGNEKGVGLGLVICQALVIKLKGSITIHSEKHKGARITVRLPDLE